MLISAKGLCVVVSLGVLVSLSACSREVGQNASENAANRNESSRQIFSQADVTAYYKMNHWRIVDIKPFPTYHAEIVESNVAPTLANDFEWWDTQTGRHYHLTGRPLFMQLKQVLSANEVEFLATGANSESPGIQFPYIMDCKRLNTDAPFTSASQTAYLPLNQSVRFGDGKKEAVSNISTTTDSATINFTSISGDEGDFMAGAYGAPLTITSYNPHTNEMMIHLKNTRLDTNATSLQHVKSTRIQSVLAQQVGTDVLLTIQLSQDTTLFTGLISHSEHPTLTFTFHP